MLYEFAMTPELFDASIVNTDNAGTVLIQLLRGIEENGLLANLNKGRWSGNIEKRSETLSQALRDKVLTCLKVLDDRHRLVRHPKCMTGNPANDMDWLNLALESHQRIPFHSIVLSQPLIDVFDQDCEVFLEFLGALDSPKWSDIRGKRTHRVEKSVNGFRQVLCPMLRYAKALTLVDAYMNYHESRFLNTVKLCSKLMGQRGHARMSGRIHIHAEANKQKPRGISVKECLDAWEQKLRPLVNQDGHRFRVFLWENKPNAQTMYDSYILTDQCGVFLHRLDCRTASHANSTDWNLLDEDERISRLQDYDPTISPFNCIGDREIFI